MTSWCMRNDGPPVCFYGTDGLSRYTLTLLGEQVLVIVSLGTATSSCSIPDDVLAKVLRERGYAVFPPGDPTLATLQTYGRARAAANAYRGSDPIEAKRLADAQQEAARALVGVSLRAAESDE